MELSIDRLFDAPALSGPAISGLKISPDGSRIVYLKARDADPHALDLWEYHLSSQRASMLVDSSSMGEAPAAASAEALARRERQRTAAFRGILEHCFADGGRRLIFSAGGNLHEYRFDAPDGGQLRRLTNAGASETDVKASPRDNRIAYVRDQNLFLLDLDTLTETPLTGDGGGAIKNGMAEFIAQEEMDRSSGFWWSPDGTRIAFARVDESPVPLTQRFDMGAEGITVVSQRYPAAGEANVLTQIGVIDLTSRDVQWLDLGADPDVYLARVNWLPGSRRVAIQRQSRDQRRLDLLLFDVQTGTSRLLLSETAACWIDLHDELTFLSRSERFIWASARDGFRHLYLYDLEGNLLRRITEGDWMVEDLRARAVKGVDEERDQIFFSATAADPTQRHLYVTSFADGAPFPPRRLTSEEGIHSISMSADASRFVDHFSSPAQPPQVSVHRVDGGRIAFLSENRIDAAHPYHAFIESDSRPEFGVLAASDGTLLHYRLFRPSTPDPARRHPAIIDVYGGPGTQRVLRNWSGAGFTQILTRAGYFVLQLDGRGSSGRGERFQSAIHGRLGAVEVEDQLRGAEWLASQDGVDRNRIGVWGWSYGGYMTLMMMFKAPGRFCAGLSGAPVTDWTLYDTHYTERYLGTPRDNADGYRASAVFEAAKALEGALMIMHGMADDNVLFTHSTQLFSVLQHLGKPFEMMTYPGGKHGLTRTADGRHAYLTIKGFFDRHL